MSILHVQHPTSMLASSSTTVQSGAFASNPTIGNRIVVMLSTFESASTGFTFSDTAGNTYAVDATFERNSVAGNFERVTIASAPVNATGASFKVTATVAVGGTAFDALLTAAEFSGIATSSYLDVTPVTAGVGNSTTSLTAGPTAAMNQAGNLLIAIMSGESSLTNESVSNPANITGPTLSTASTSLGVSQDFSTINGGQHSYAIASSTAAASANWTYTSDSVNYAQYVAALAVYKPAATVTAVVPQIQVAPQIDIGRAAGFGLVVAAAAAAPLLRAVLRPITTLPQFDPTPSNTQVFDPAFNPNVVSTLALSQIGVPPQDDSGAYYGQTYKAVVAPPAVSGILGRFIFASQADPSQIAPQLTAARATPPPGVIGARIFVPFQNVDLTLQSVYMEPWHGPQGAVPPYRFASQADPTQIQPIDVMAAPILPVIHGPTIRPVQFTPAQFDITINGTKYWTPSTFSPGTQGVLHMPNLIGLNYYMALETLQVAGIYLPLPVYAFSPSSITVKWARSPYPGGIVIAQSIPTGTTVRPGQAITLTVSYFPFGGVIDSPPDWSQPS